MAILYFILGALLYRWRGAAHKWKKFTPRPIPQLLFSLPYAYEALDKGYIAAGVVFVLTTLAVSTGHGNWMDLGRSKIISEPERLEFLIKPLETRLSSYWYDFTGLALTGVVVTIPLGILMLNPFIAMSGCLKAFAYAIGKNTKNGEYLTGGFLWATLASI